LSIYNPETGGFIRFPNEDQLVEFSTWETHPDDWNPPPFVAPPQPDLTGFTGVIRVPLTRPFLDTLAGVSPSLKDDLRDAFNQRNIPNVIQFWNEAIATYSAILIPVLNTPYNGGTLSSFANDQAVAFNVPLIINEDGTLSEVTP